jgi:hypothetical protein
LNDYSGIEERAGRPWQPVGVSLLALSLGAMFVFAVVAAIAVTLYFLAWAAFGS